MKWSHWQYLCMITSWMSWKSFQLLCRAFPHKMDIDLEFHIVCIDRHSDQILWLLCQFLHSLCTMRRVSYALTARRNSLIAKERLSNDVATYPLFLAFKDTSRIVNLSSWCLTTPSTSRVVNSSIFDSDGYCALCTQDVEIDGQKLGHKFFSDPRDIALSLCIDSFLLFKWCHGGPSGTPILLKNHNVPLWLTNQLKHLICIGLMS